MTVFYFLLATDYNTLLAAAAVEEVLEIKTSDQTGMGKMLSFL